MGFFDDLWDLGEEFTSLMGDLFWQIGDDAKDVGRKIVEVKHDCEDMAVSGITSMLTGEGEVNTSSEIRREANAIIQKSNSKYRSIYEKTEKRLLDLEKNQKNLFGKKETLARLMNQKFAFSIRIPTQIAPFKLGESERHVDEVLPELFKLPLYKAPALNGLVTFISAGQRLDEAREYKSQAKDYEVKIEGEIAKIKRMESCICKIEGIFKEEEEILKVIHRSLEMNRPLGYKKIVHELEVLLAESILDRSGKTNIRYEIAVNELKDLVSK